MTIKPKIASWRHLGAHLGRLGRHLGAQKLGRWIPRNEQAAESILPGRRRAPPWKELEGLGVNKPGIYTL